MTFSPSFSPNFSFFSNTETPFDSFCKCSVTIHVLDLCKVYDLTSLHCNFSSCATTSCPVLEIKRFALCQIITCRKQDPAPTPLDSNIPIMILISLAVLVCLSCTCFATFHFVKRMRTTEMMMRNDGRIELENLLSLSNDNYYDTFTDVDF